MSFIFNVLPAKNCTEKFRYSVPAWWGGVGYFSLICPVHADHHVTDLEVGPYKMSMANDNDILLRFTPTTEQSIHTEDSELSFSNTCPYGASITIATDSPSNGLTQVGSGTPLGIIPATTSTSLSDNSWGYSVDSGSSYRPVPILGGADVIYNKSAQANQEKVSIKIGIKTNKDALPGEYTQKIVYTLVADERCQEHAIVWDFNGGSQKTGVTYPSRLGWGSTINLSEFTPEREGFVFLGWTNGEEEFTGTEINANINPSHKDMISMKAKWKLTNLEKNFEFTEASQSFVAPEAGYYKLEVWGAQGGDAVGGTGVDIGKGGFGSYSVGLTHLEANEKLYIYVGGGGNTMKQGGIETKIYAGDSYNGGGRATIQRWTGGQLYAGGGGGATHISKTDTLLKDTKISDLIIVAGGGGGGTSNDCSLSGHRGHGGYAGGDTGTSGNSYVWSGGIGGSQQSMGSDTAYCAANTDLKEYEIAQGYGQGCSPNSQYRYNLRVAGGGGYYGGQCGCHGGGGGGSGYIGSDLLISNTNITKHMTCYACAANAYDKTRTVSVSNHSSDPIPDYAKSDNGYAKITWVGNTL